MTKTDREIELEKKVAAGLRCEKIHLNRAFRAEKKLEIARKNLKEIGDAIAIYFRREHTKDFAEDTLMGIGIVVGQTEQALKEIRECQKNTD